MKPKRIESDGGGASLKAGVREGFCEELILKLRLGGLGIILETILGNIPERE